MCLDFCYFLQVTLLLANVSYAFDLGYYYLYIYVALAGCRLTDLSKNLHRITLILLSKLIDLKAFAVDNGRTRFVVFGLGDPHLLEGGKGGKDGTTDPDRVLSFWRSDDLDLHG